MHRSGVWRLDQQLKKTGNLFHLLPLLFHLLPLNVSSEVLEKVSKTRKKVKSQEAEEMVAVEEQVILLTAVTVSVLIFVSITAGLNVERENTNLLMQRKHKFRCLVLEFSTPLSF